VKNFAEATVKQLTGIEDVTARFLFAEEFTFTPEFKLWAATNHKPEIVGTDNAIWDRVRLIPFEVRFEGKAVDVTLPDKLRAEAPGVLAWLVRGCLEWQEKGLGTAAKIEAASKEYREEMDTFASFLEEECVVRPDAHAPAAALYLAYQRWADRSGQKTESKKWFGARLKERGFKDYRPTRGPNRNIRSWEGVGLRSDDGGPDDGPFDGGNGPTCGAHAPDDQKRGADEIGVDKPDSRGEEESAPHAPQEFTSFQGNSLAYGKVVEKRGACGAYGADSSFLFIDTDEGLRKVLDTMKGESA
jgi:hypothetical protein